VENWIPFIEWQESPMKSFDPKWGDFPHFIVGITKEIWEDRQIALLETCYAKDIIVRGAGGIKQGCQAVIDDTLAKMAAFPDLQCLAEDVIWSGGETQHYLSSHRTVITGTQTGDSIYGPATGKRYYARCIADCAVTDGVFDDEWLVFDSSSIVKQLGHDPRDFVRRQIATEGGAATAKRPFTPDQDRIGAYTLRGNGNVWGGRFAEILERIMRKDIVVIGKAYDRAVRLEHPGGQGGWSWEFAEAAWMGLRSSFPRARFTIHHVIGNDEAGRTPRAAVRWSLDGRHDGYGRFGAPTGAEVHVMGISHAEFGPWGVQREFTQYDELAIWKQIEMQV
jgi:predicted ester cyclase